MAGCKVIGILGGIGSGKSEAVQYMKTRYGAYVIKADDVAKSLYKKGQPGYKAILRCCGKSVLDSGRNIDRTSLASRLYENPMLLKTVNDAIHPMVYRKTKEMIASYRKKHPVGLIVYEAALFSDPVPRFLDEIWIIHSESEIRKNRLRKYRGYTDERISEIMSFQPSDSEYSAIGDIIIENNSGLEDLEKAIDEIFEHCKRQQRKFDIRGN